MTRIMVIGNAGNGKTTLCKKLGARLGIGEKYIIRLASPRETERWLKIITS